MSSPIHVRTILNKVPEITIFFWIVKILCTTVGETFADFLNMNLHFGLTNTTLIMSTLLVIALGLQFRLRRYLPSAYWMVVVLVSVVGTLITDNLTDHLGISLITSSIVFGILLAVVFGTWYMQEKTLSIHSIDSFKREAYYWAAILFTFALGTAVGDLVAEQFGFGYWISALLFGGIIALITFGRFGLKLNAVATFWAAYILTRPLGASIGDLLAQSRGDGGLGFGVVTTSALFLVLIALLVGYFTFTKSDTVPVEADE